MNIKNRKKKVKSRKKFIIRFSVLMIIIGSFIVIPIEVMYRQLVKQENIDQAKFQTDMDNLQKFIKAKNDINKICKEEDESIEIKNMVAEIQSKMGVNFTDDFGQLVDRLNNRISEISNENLKQLSGKYNSIIDTKKNEFVSEDKSQENTLTVEYETLLNQGEYIKANESLINIEVFIKEANKRAEAQNIKEQYVANAKEDPSTRSPFYINDILLVNKLHGLPITFGNGENAEARAAFEQMRSDATTEGIYLQAFSTYRSYWNQSRLYSNYVATCGQDPTDTFSAKPGFSEHQTGLAFDIGGPDRSLWGESAFKNTMESKWLAENAYKYGFILRYPEGKEWKTGYMFESWHYRYIGKEHSKNFNNNNLTLEEYLGQ